MNLRTLLPLAPAGIRPVLSHILDRFESVEKRLAALEAAQAQRKG
jgi:hypothetical protein